LFIRPYFDSYWLQFLSRVQPFRSFLQQTPETVFNLILGYDDTSVFSVSVQAYVSVYSQKYNKKYVLYFRSRSLVLIVAKLTPQDVYWHGFKG
jgi:hypothetical protein